MKKYFLLTQLLFSTFVFPQSVDSLIQIYPGIGDTIDAFTSNYIGLFPEIKDFSYAVFYVRDHKSLITKIYSSNDYSLNEIIRIHKLSSIDSLQFIIHQIDLINLKLLNEPRDFSLFTNEGNFIEGEIEMFDENYIYVIAEGVRADHLGRMKYRIPVKDISEINLEGSSNVLLGVCIGGAAGAIIGLVVMNSVANSAKTKEANNFDESVSNCSSKLGAGLAGATAFGAITLGGLLIGAIIGVTTSTDDELVKLQNEKDVLKLTGRVAYVLNKESIKKIKYYEVY